jgi:ABC-type antimicrobial peptide transport system permease subunit
LSFELKNKNSISEFKEYLEETGYGSRGKIGQIRKSITIDDNALVLSVSGLQKNVGYMEALYPVIFALVIAIGFVVSYLLTKSRRAELAVMRSMGAGSVRTFFTLFTEQLILCIFGATIGILASLFFTKQFVFEHYISIAIYVACYMAGIVISAMAMNRLNVLKILTSND